MWKIVLKIFIVNRYEGTYKIICYEFLKFGGRLQKGNAAAK